MKPGPDAGQTPQKRGLPWSARLEARPLVRPLLITALITLLILLPGWWYACIWYEDRLIEEEKGLVMKQAALHSTLLANAVNRRIGLLEGSYAFSATVPEDENFSGRFERYAMSITSSVDGIRNIGIYPGGITRYIYPLKGNEAVLGSSLMNDTRPEVQKDLQTAISSGTVVLSGPYELRQGGKGLVARRARTENGSFWGFVTLVMDMDPILREASLDENEPDTIRIAVKDEQGRVFSGDPGIFMRDPVTSAVLLPGETWNLGVVPAEGWTAAVALPVAVFRIVTGVLVILLAVLCFMVLSRQESLTRTVDERTQDLVSRSRELDLAIRSARIGLYDWDLVTSRVTYSKEWKAQIGYAEDEIGEEYSEWESRVHPDDREQTVAKIREFIEHPSPGFHVEFRFRHRDGSYRWIMSQAGLVQGPKGRPVRMIGSHIDITGPKSLETELRRAYRARSAISELNQALLHADDEQALMQQLCDILVTTAGYRMAWAGIVGQEEGRPVRLVASAGTDREYLEGLDITWADVERGHGPTGTAARTGEAVICRHILTDPAFAPWREKAVRHGFGSSVALPVREGTGIIGVLSIYATEADAFDTTEMGLLTELAIDLSLGIASIRTAKERARIQEALLENEERLSFALEGANDGIWDVNMVTGEVYISPRGCAILEFTPDTLAACLHSWEDLVHPDDLPASREALRTYLAGGPPVFDLEQRLVTGTAGWKWVRTRGKVVARDGEGRPVRMTGTFTDISGEKKAAQALKVRDELLSLTGSMAQVGGWQFDVTTGQGTWTEEVARIHDLDPEIPASVDLGLSFYTPESRARVNAAIALAVANGTPYDLELEMVSAAGTRKWVRSKGIPVTREGRVTRIQGVFQDITPYKRVEAELREIRAQLEEKVTERTRELREREERFSFSLEAADVGAWVLDLVNHTAWRSLRHDQIFGYQELLPTWTYEIFLGHVVPDDRGVVNGKFARAIADSTEWDFECRIRRKDGVFRWIWARGRPEFDRQGRAERMFGLVQDITERKNAEEVLHLMTEDLEEANRKLQELDRLKSLFIASMSHELRTPLNSIIGFTGIILMGYAGGVTDEQKKQLGMVQESARHLLSLINDVIDLSKIEADKVEIRLSEFDLGNVILMAADEFRTQATDQGLGLVVSLPGPLVIWSDERRVRQIISNLISNAVKFTDEGSVTVNAGEDGETVRVTVADTGIGIGPEHLDTLFRAFTRINTPGRLTEGTGLGLYLSQKLARLLMGEISVQSTPGKGTVFTLTLPKGPGKPPGP